MDCCPHCGQPLVHVRMGVRLTPLKARIFDLVKRGGGDGIPRESLLALTYEDGDSTVRWDSLKSHVNQINDLLVATDWKITFVPDRCYALRRREGRA